MQLPHSLDAFSKSHAGNFYSCDLREIGHVQVLRRHQYLEHILNSFKLFSWDLEKFIVPLVD